MVLFVAHSFVYMLHFDDLKLKFFLLRKSTHVASLSDYLDELRYRLHLFSRMS